MISDTARRFSMTPVWSLPRSTSRFPRLPAWLGFVAFAFVVCLLIIRQLTQPDGYYGDSEDVVTSAVGSSSSSSSTKTFSSWNPASWTSGSIFGSIPTQSKPNSFLSPDREIKVVITSAMRTHDEVAAPLIAAFGSIPGVNLTGILISQVDRFGANEMFRNLKVDSLQPIPNPRHYQDNINWLLKNPPDILVTATCNYDLWESYLPLFDKTNMHVFCVVHHADPRWNDEYPVSPYVSSLGKWVAADRVDIVTLSPHVTDAFRPLLAGWKALKHKTILPPVHTFPPVFEINLPDLSSEGADEISFGIQGKYESVRRNYTRTFEEVGEMKTVLEAEDDKDLEASLRLHMVGSGKRPSVPAGLETMVVFDEELNFTDYYSVISSMNAMLPAFADDDYYVTKASSSIPAALVGGGPLVATRQLLDSYSYLEEDAVWIQREDQSDIDVMWEIVRKPRWEREQKQRHARMLGAKLSLQAKKLAAEWVNEVIKRRTEREGWFEPVNRKVVEEEEAGPDSAIMEEQEAEATELEKEKEKGRS